jgi:hypothetical protein
MASMMQAELEERERPLRGRGPGQSSAAPRITAHLQDHIVWARVHIVSDHVPSEDKKGEPYACVNMPWESVHCDFFANNRPQPRDQTMFRILDQARDSARSKQGASMATAGVVFSL